MFEFLIGSRFVRLFTSLSLGCPTAVYQFHSESRAESENLVILQLEEASYIVYYTSHWSRNPFFLLFLRYMTGKLYGRYYRKNRRNYQVPSNFLTITRRREEPRKLFTRENLEKHKNWIQFSQDYDVSVL